MGCPDFSSSKVTATALIAEPNPGAFDIRHQAEIHVVAMPFVAAFTGVRPGKPDTAVLDTIDGADVDAIRADHLHVLFDAIVVHIESPLSSRTFPFSIRTRY